MKRWLFLILAMLLLTGCGAEPDTTDPSAEPTEAAVQSSTEPTGYYDPNSALEESTGGAVRAYPLNRSDSYGLVTMGSDLLLLSGSEVTTLTKLAGSNLYVSAAANLDCYIDAGSPAFHAGDKGVTYYDGVHRELVFLDTDLKEVRRVSLPEAIIGDPALTTDRKNIYYLTDDQLRAIDLETDLDKLVKEIFFPSQSLSALHCGDSILQCRVIDSYDNSSSLFISAKTGETVWESFEELSLWTQDDSYFAIHADGEYQELLTGTAGQEPALLISDTEGISAEAVLDINGAVLFSFTDETTSLNLYDLKTGVRTSALELSGGWYPWGIQSSAEQNCIWFMRYDDNYDSDVLCRWDLTKTAVNDESGSLTPRYTAENPDAAGIAACQETAEAIAQKYGIEILLWTAAIAQQPCDYAMEPEYQVSAITRYLEILDQALAKYPSGFLKKAASGTNCGKIRISLVRSLAATEADLPENVNGIQYWADDGNTYVALALGTGMEQTLYHELFHVIDSYVLSNCSVYDTWEDLNPQGFSYMYSYTSHMEDLSGFLESADRAFIDEYSMSFPREDRARIMEYAMMPGNESCFASETMQLKLRTLCHGIRDAFGLKKSTESFPWEQYLKG